MKFKIILILFCVGIYLVETLVEEVKYCEKNVCRKLNYFRQYRSQLHQIHSFNVWLALLS